MYSKSVTLKPVLYIICDHQRALLQQQKHEAASAYEINGSVRNNDIKLH